MKRQVAALTAVTAVTLTLVVGVNREWWSSSATAADKAQSTTSQAILVDVATARRQGVPVRLTTLGTVTPIATMAIKPRLETVIVKTHVQSGQDVKEGDILFTLDARQTEAEIRRTEAVIAGATAQLQQAERDVVRYADLLGKNATTVVTHNNALTQVNILRATVEASKAALDNLKVQLDFATIRAPMSGRISGVVGTGSFVRSSDTTPLATIIQMAPIHVAFAVSQDHIGDVRTALEAGTAIVNLTGAKLQTRSSGRVTSIESMIDASTGMVTLRATMPNTDLTLWPGALVSTQLMLRNEPTLVVPQAAVQAGQVGSFVFVINDGHAEMRRVVISRVVDGLSVIAEGLEEGEIVVTDGHMLLTNGAAVRLRQTGEGA